MEFELQDKSELTYAEQKVVHTTAWSSREFGHAYQLLRECSEFFALPVPEESDIEMAAKVIAALPTERLPKTVQGKVDIHPTWLMTESWILQGKDPTPIHIAALKVMIKRL